MYIPPLPPQFGKPARGKMATKRRMEPDKKVKDGQKKGKGKNVRMKRQQTTIRCSKCRGEDHNVKTCEQ